MMCTCNFDVPAPAMRPLTSSYIHLLQRDTRVLLVLEAEHAGHKVQSMKKFNSIFFVNFEQTERCILEKVCDRHGAACVLPGFYVEFAALKTMNCGR